MGWRREELVAGDEEKDRTASDIGLAPYRCPECNANVYQPYEGVDRFICLNACHLSLASRQRLVKELSQSKEETK